MSKKDINKAYFGKLTKKEKKELEKLLKQITDEAKLVVEDYGKNPSELDSGSVVQIHSNSPLINSSSKK